MIISRRNFLRAASLAPFANLFVSGQPAFAQSGAAVSPSAVFTRKVGKLEVSLLAERQQTATKDILIGATPEILKNSAPDGTFPNAINAFLVRLPAGIATRPTSSSFESLRHDKVSAKNILVDTGFGIKLFDNLKTLGVAAADVDVVLITHMHGDHIGGLLREGEATFPKAAIYISQREHAYWTSATHPKDSLQNRVVAAYKERLHLFPSTATGVPARDLKLFPEGIAVRPIAAYGHTPGHTLYLLSSGGERLLIWGDLTHAMAVQMPFPQVAVTYDVDSEQAVASRKTVLEFVVKTKISVAGMHIAYPGMGVVSANPDKDSGYKFAPF